MSLEAMQNAPVRDFLESRPIFSESDRVSRGIGYLRENREYELFVGKEKRLAVATVRDLLAVKNPQSSKLGNIVYFAPELNENDSVGKAARLMFDYRLRALPAAAVDGEVKAVSARGIIQKISESASSRVAVSGIMTPSPISVDAEDTAAKARLIMMRRSIDHLPVMQRGKLYGMLTSSHLLFNLLPEESAHPQDLGENTSVRFDYPVKRIAEESPIEVDGDARLSEVIQTMIKLRSSYVLATVWGEVQGIVTLRDVVKLLVRRESSRVPYYIVGLPKEPFESEGAKMKFERMSASLSKAFPFIQEIRAIIKVKDTGSERKRYEVHVNVYTPRDVFAYSEEGYELPDIFDAVAPKLKRLLGSKQSKVTKTHGRSLRKMQ